MTKQNTNYYTYIFKHRTMANFAINHQHRGTSCFNPAISIHTAPVRCEWAKCATTPRDVFCIFV